jgi:hypothetical protein
MTIDELFQNIAEKTTNNENISVELNDLMTSVKSLQGVNTQQEQQIKELQDYNSKLKDANSNLLLSKGFVSRFEKEPEPEPEEDKPRNIKDFIKFD